MKLHKIETGNFKLDGGAMFGVVPKSLWQKVYPADENNMCNLSLRLMLIETGKKKILIDTGLGNKQDDKFFSYYYLNGEDTLDRSLKKTGVSKDAITDVVLTHLHFDHCGGALEYNELGKLRTAFPAAVYWCSRNQWNWAMNPNRREKASFLVENILPLENSGQLRLFDQQFELTPDVSIHLYNGHTRGLSVPFIRYNGRTIVFVADLIPTSAHIPLAWICGYDIQPLVSLAEKEAVLAEAEDKGYVLFFEHDLSTECCTLKMTEKGVRKDHSFGLDDFIKGSYLNAAENSEISA